MKTGRNDPCPCGSGKKFKHCCFGKTAPPENLPITRDDAMRAVTCPQTEPTRRPLGPAIPPEASAFLEDDQESASSAAIRGLLVDFCGRFLTYEVTTRVFRLCDRLDLGTEFSLNRGHPEIWAAAIAYAIAQVNVLFDPEASLGVSAADIHAFFGAKPDTVRSKARQIRHVLGIDFGHPAYCTTDLVAAATIAESPGAKNMIPGGDAQGSRAPDNALRRSSFGDGSRQNKSGKHFSRSDIPGKQMRLFDD
jgi:hypothetical protein